MPNNERFSSLYSRDFRLFWIGQIISNSGTWMHSTAQGWLVYSLTKSPYHLGLVSAASSLPILMFSLIGGVAADRFRKRNLLLLTQGLAIIPALVIGILTSTGLIGIPHLLVLVFLLGTINAFDIPARQSFLIEMVERGNLLNAIALNSAAFNGARLVGPVLAGFIIAGLGLPACFYLNALSYVAVIAALSQIRAKGEQMVGGGNILRDIKEGVNFIRRSPDVRRPMMLVATFSLFGMPFIVLLPVFAVEVLDVGAKGLGFLIGASGAGALVAALTIAIKGEIKKKNTVVKTASIIFPFALFLFASSSIYPLSLALLAVLGLTVVTFLATANSTIQLSTPDTLRGRVMSVYTLVFLGMMPPGNYITGVLAHLLGTVNTVRLAAIICFTVSIIILYTGRKHEDSGH